MKKMDAVAYFKIRERMCKKFDNCCDCPISESNSGHNVVCTDFEEAYPEEAVNIIEQWKKEHPLMTNAMKFEEVFGRTYMSLPSFVGEWLEQEYKEPKGEK